MWEGYDAFTTAHPAHPAYSLPTAYLQPARPTRTLSVAQTQPGMFVSDILNSSRMR